VIGYLTRQQVVVGISVRCPFAFVEAPAEDPLTGGARSSFGNDQLHRVFLADHAAQIHPPQVAAEACGMRMRFHQSGDHRRPGEIDHLGVGSAVGGDIGGCPERDDTTVFDGERFGIRVPAGRIVRCVGGGFARRTRIAPVERINTSLGENQVSRLHRRRGAAADRQRGENEDNCGQAQGRSAIDRAVVFHQRVSFRGGCSIGARPRSCHRQEPASEEKLHGHFAVDEES